MILKWQASDAFRQLGTVAKPQGQTDEHPQAQDTKEEWPCLRDCHPNKNSKADNQNSPDATSGDSER